MSPIGLLVGRASSTTARRVSSGQRVSLLIANVSASKGVLDPGMRSGVDTAGVQEGLWTRRCFVRVNWRD